MGIRLDDSDLAGLVATEPPPAAAAPALRAAPATGRVPLEDMSRAIQAEFGPPPSTGARAATTGRVPLEDMSRAIQAKFGPPPAAGPPTAAPAYAPSATAGMPLTPPPAAPPMTMQQPAVPVPLPPAAAPAPPIALNTIDPAAMQTAGLDVRQARNAGDAAMLAASGYAQHPQRPELWVGDARIAQPPPGIPAWTSFEPASVTMAASPEAPELTIGQALVDVPLDKAGRTLEAGLASLKRGFGRAGQVIGAGMIAPEAAVTAFSRALPGQFPTRGRLSQAEAVRKLREAQAPDETGMNAMGERVPIEQKQPDLAARGADLLAALDETVAENYPANPAQQERGDALRFLDPEWYATHAPESAAQTATAMAVSSVAGPVAAAGLYGLAEMGGNFGDIERQFMELGYSQDQARRMAGEAALGSGVVNAGVGGYMGTEALLGRVGGKVLGDLAKTTAGRIALRAGVGAVSEGATEVLEGETPAEAAKLLDRRIEGPTNKERATTLAVSALTGGLLGGGHGALELRGERAQERQELQFKEARQQANARADELDATEARRAERQARPLALKTGKRALARIERAMASEAARVRMLATQLFGDQATQWAELTAQAEQGDQAAMKSVSDMELRIDPARRIEVRQLQEARARQYRMLEQAQDIIARAGITPENYTAAADVPAEPEDATGGAPPAGSLPDRMLDSEGQPARRPATPSEASTRAAAVARLNEGWRAQMQAAGQPDPGDVYTLETRPAMLARRNLRFAELIARRVFGTTVVPVRAGRGAPDAFGFQQSTQPGVVFVDSGSTVAPFRVIAHELAHTMAVELAGTALMADYMRALERALDLPQARAQYRAGRAVAGQLSDAAIDEELLAEQLSTRLGDKHFWRQVRDANPTIFNRMAFRLLEIIDKIERVLGRNVEGETVEKMMTDAGLIETRRALARLVAEQGRRTAARRRIGPDVQTPREFGVGKEAPFFTAGGDQYAVRWRVVPVADVVASNEPETFTARPEYPADVQPRNYEARTGEQEKVVAGAQGLNPWLVTGQNYTGDGGAPVVAQDEAGRLIALSGNGRTQMIQRAHALHPERAHAYQEHLATRAAEYGIDPATITQATGPMMLVRELVDAPRDQWEAIARAGNVGQAREYDETEAAIDLSRKIDDRVLLAGLDLQGDETLADVMNNPGRRERFIDALVQSGAVTNQNEGRYIERLADGGRQLTEAGRKLIELALLAKAFEGPQQAQALELLAAWPALGRAVSASIPQLVKIRGYLARGLSPAYNLPGMLHTLASAMRRLDVKNWAELRERPDMFNPSTPFERGVGQVLADVITMPAKLRERVKAFAEFAEAALNNQGGMMPLTPGEVLIGWADEQGIELEDRAALEAVTPELAGVGADADGFQFMERRRDDASDLFSSRQEEAPAAPQAAPTGQGDLFSAGAFGAATPSLDARVGPRDPGSDLAGQMDIFGADVPGVLRVPKDTAPPKPAPPRQLDLFKFMEAPAAEAGATSPDEIARASHAWRVLGIESPWFKRWFGDWRAIEAAQALRTMQPVTITGREIATMDLNRDDLPLKALRLKARAWTTNHLRPQVTNARTGWEIEIRPAGIKNALAHGSGPQKIQALAALPELLERAELIHSGFMPDNPQLLSHVFAAKLKIEQAEFMVGLVAREDAEGKLFYDHELMNVEATAAGIPSQARSTGEPLRTPPAARLPVHDIVRNTLEVKPEAISKVVDAQGRPLVVYHRTAADFSQFDPSRAKGGDVAGLYFSASADTPTAPISETDRVLPVYLRLTNPATSEDKRRIAGQIGRDWTPEQMASAMQREGFDGLIDTDYRATEYIAFSPEQIKSAIGNRGTFDAANPDIRMQERRREAEDVVQVAPPAPLGERMAALARARGGLPEVVFEANLKRVAAISENQRRLRDLHRDLRRGVRKVWKRESLVPTPMVHAMNSALRGGLAINELPEPVRLPLMAIRDYIDRLSREMIESGLVDEGLAAVIERNLRLYMHRSYRISEKSEDWINRIPRDVFNRAVDYTHRALIRARAHRLLYPTDETPPPVDWFDANVAQMLARAAAEITREDAERHLRNFLNDRAARPKESMQTLKIGAKDLTIFMRKTEVSDEIRAVLGEYSTPDVNSAKSITKMGAFIANETFLRQVRDVGLGVFLFEPDQAPPGFNEQLAGEASRVMSPLNGLRTSPEIAKAFEALDAPMSENAILVAWMKLNSWFKVSKTVGSIMTQAVNLAGQPLFNLMNGHYNLKRYGDGVRAVLTDWGALDSAALRERLYRYVGLGLIGNSVVAEELRATIEDARFKDWGAKKDKWPAAARRLWDLAAGALDGAMAVYESSDSLGKVVGFENELARIRRMQPGLMPAEQEEIAARRVLNTYPTYSMLPTWATWFRRFPVLAPFVAFSYESVRTVGWSIRYAFEDMNSGTAAGRIEGAARLAGTLAAVGLILPAVQFVSMLAAGVSGDDDEDFRRFQPDWAKTGYFLYLGKKNGQIRAIHLSRYSPYSYLSEPLGELVRGAASGDWERWGQAVRRAVKDVAEPWISNQLGTAALVEMGTNRTRTGQRIRNPEQGVLQQAGDLAVYGLRAGAPGTLTRFFDRMVPAARGEVTAYGAQLDLSDEVIAEFSGARVMSLDVRQALQFATRNMGREGRDATVIFNETVTKQGKVEPGAIVGAYIEANAVRFAQWRQMYGNVKAARRQGLTDEEIGATIDQSGFSGDNTAALMAGQFVPIELWSQRGRPTAIMRRAEAIPGRALPVEQLAALEEERRGWVLD